MHSEAAMNEPGCSRDFEKPILPWWRSKRFLSTIAVMFVLHVAALALILFALGKYQDRLGFAGLLNGLHATTHWRSLYWMRDSFPEVIVEYEQHIVSDGSVFTSAGISAGLEMALKVVARYYGKDIAQATAAHMEYSFPISNERRIRFKPNL
jgi:transcriptional regulator GlxA family with amidase domain